MQEWKREAWVGLRSPRDPTRPRLPSFRFCRLNAWNRLSLLHWHGCGAKCSELSVYESGLRFEHRFIYSTILSLKRSSNNTFFIWSADPARQSTNVHSLPLWVIILVICGTVVGVGLVLIGSVQLYCFVAAKSQNGAAAIGESHSEEIELFCSENV